MSGKLSAILAVNHPATFQRCKDAYLAALESSEATSGAHGSGSSSRWTPLLEADMQEAAGSDNDDSEDAGSEQDASDDDVEVSSQSMSTLGHAAWTSCGVGVLC
jgi:hypothetical protein